MTDPTPLPDLDEVRKFAEGLAKEGTYSHYTGGTRRIFTDASRRHIRLADEVERLREDIQVWKHGRNALTLRVDRLTRDLEAERAMSSDFDLDEVWDNLEELAIHEAWSGVRSIARWFYNKVVVARKENTELQNKLTTTRTERDLAVAHDRQPYPTADAYEKVCVLLETEREASRGLREALEKIAVQKLTEEMDAAFVDYADYEGGYEALIVIARAALDAK